MEKETACIVIHGRRRYFAKKYIFANNGKLLVRHFLFYNLAVNPECLGIPVVVESEQFCLSS